MSIVIERYKRCGHKLLIREKEAYRKHRRLVNAMPNALDTKIGTCTNQTKGKFQERKTARKKRAKLVLYRRE